jgi:hypothetical protein
MVKMFNHRELRERREEEMMGAEQMNPSVPSFSPWFKIP